MNSKKALQLTVVVIFIDAILFAIVIFLVCCPQKADAETYTPKEALEMDIYRKVAPTISLKKENDLPYSFEEEVLLMQLVEAEAGNQPLTGKRFVVDVVMNRVEDPRFPDTITDVIFEPGQFSVVEDGSLAAIGYGYSKESLRAVIYELNEPERLDTGILYFSSTEEPVNGERAFRYYDHWFSY